MGIASLSGPEYVGLPSRVAGLVPEGSGPGELNLATQFAASERRSLSRATCLAVVAAEEAARSAGWRPQTETEQVGGRYTVFLFTWDLEFEAKLDSSSNLLCVTCLLSVMAV